MTSHLEVAQCTLGDWEKAILASYEVWRQVQKNQGGKVIVDLNARSIIFRKCSVPLPCSRKIGRFRKFRGRVIR